MDYGKKIFWLILIATAARLIIAGSIELGNDEVYYWTYALHLQWNYFDHPPTVGWLIRLTTVNLLSNTELSVRIGAIISSAICTFLIYKTGIVVKDAQTGWYAALLYTASVYGSIIAGTFILPDSPQMVFWLWSILLLIKIINLPANSPQTQKLWLWFGVSAGLCMISKIHGCFLWLGAASYIVIFDRSLLRKRGVYLSASISLLIVSPVIIWNIQNNFISYFYHGSRVSLLHSQIHADGFIRELAGQLFYNNPLNFLLIWSTLFLLRKGKLSEYKKDIRLLLCCSLPLIGVLLIVSLFKDTLPHWSGPAYSCLLILPAVRLASVNSNASRSVHTFLKLSLAFIAILSIAGIAIINFFPGTLSPQKSGENTGEGDPTLDMYGWRQAGVKIDSVFKKDIAQHTMSPNSPIIITKWFPAAHIDFYIASFTHRQTYGIGNLFDLHQYHWYNQYKPQIKKGDAAYFIIPSNLYKQEDIEQLKKSFFYISSPVIIPVYRNEVICKKYYIYRLKGYR